MASVLNPVNILPREMVLYDSLATNIYLVDGNGGYDSLSGASGSTVIATLGQAGATPLWTNSSWTLITGPAGWTGKLSPNSAALVAIFATLGTNPVELEFAINITNQAGDPVSYANALVNFWKRFPGTAVSTNPFANSGDGAFSIPNGADVGAVTGLNLTLIPRRVMVSVRKPAGGLQLFASVEDGSITTDGFKFTLNGQTDAGTYKLDYVLLY